MTNESDVGPEEKKGQVTGGDGENGVRPEPENEDVPITGVPVEIFGQSEHDTAESGAEDDGKAGSPEKEEDGGGEEANPPDDGIDLKAVAEKHGISAAENENGGDEEKVEKAHVCYLSGEQIKRCAEVVIFRSASSVKPARIAKIIGRGVTPGMVNKALKELKKDYDDWELSFEVVNVAGGWQMVSRPEYGEVVERMVVHRETKKLTPTMLEVLALIAFKQPLTRQEIDEVRGVDSSGVLRTLMERGLVTLARDYDKLGKPFVYTTTQKFLEVFGLKSLKDLPKATELHNISDR